MSLFSPAHPRCAEMHLSPGVVLASRQVKNEVEVVEGVYGND
jgi:hypothetical protein